MTLMDMVGVALALIANMVIGAFWYSPKFLGRVWASSNQFEMAQLKATPFHYVGAVLVNFIMVLAYVLIRNMASFTTLMSNIRLGFLIWIGFIATSHFSGVIWAKKPVLVYLIDISYLFVVIMVTSIVFAIV